MGRGSEKNRSQRLDECLGLLRSRESWTTQELSKELSISSRTLLRDFSLLKERGIPIESEPGRGGGVRLYKHWAVGKLHLNYHETIDLLLALAVMEKMNSPLLLKNIKSIRRRIAVTFPDSSRTKLLSLRRRILLGELASKQVLASYRPPTENVAPVHEAFLEQKQLQIIYTNEKQERALRWIEPQFLFLNWPVWYILAWDRQKKDARFFRLDRVESAQVLSEDFSLREESLLLPLIEQFGRSI